MVVTFGGVLIPLSMMKFVIKLGNQASPPSRLAQCLIMSLMVSPTLIAWPSKMAYMRDILGLSTM